MSDSHLLRHRLTLLPGSRLDSALHSFLVERFPELSRNQVKRALENRWIRKSYSARQDSQALSPSLKVEASPLELELEMDWLALEREFLPRALLPRAQGCAVEILYEDEHLLVINKPSGMPSAPLHYDEENTAVHHALAHFPGLPRTHPKEPGLLHRLDTGTSGCLAFAKTQSSFDFYKSSWKSGQVRKLYLAQIDRPLQERPPLEIQLPLGHDCKSSKRMCVVSDRNASRIRGKALPAQTRIVEVHPLDEGRFEVLIEITTGVMHQIRAHMAHIGAPLLGDLIYGGTPAERLMLHAVRLILPNRGACRSEELVVTANWPPSVCTAR